MSSDFFNKKKIPQHCITRCMRCRHDILNCVCAGQPGGVHDAGQFVVSSSHTQLSIRYILNKFIIRLRNINIQSYLIRDTTYPNRSYMLKNYKPANPVMVDKMRVDFVVNDRRVVIEHTFGSLKNRWHILKDFNISVEKLAAVTLACCVLHNCYEI